MNYSCCALLMQIKSDAFIAKSRLLWEFCSGKVHWDQDIAFYLCKESQSIRQIIIKNPPNPIPRVPAESTALAGWMSYKYIVRVPTMKRLDT